MSLRLGYLQRTSRSSFSTLSRINQHKMAIEWNVIIYDKPGADRSVARSQHLAEIPDLVNSGAVTSVGALYHDVEKTKFAGSTLHVVSESKEGVIDVLKKDIFYKKGIWDIDSVIVNPMGVACRLPKKMDGVTVGF